MAKRYYSTLTGECALLDELLCEYVDGTIDRTVRAAFDECMSADKSLAERVECLRRTRRLLEQYRCHETSGVQLRVRKRLFREMHALHEDATILRSLSPFLGAGAIAALILCAMLMTGPAGQLPEHAAEVEAQPPVTSLAGDLPMTPLAGPVPEIPVQLASGPPLLQMNTATLQAYP